MASHHSILKQRMVASQTVSDFLAIQDTGMRTAILDQFDRALGDVRLASEDPSHIAAAVTQLTMLRDAIDRSGYAHYLGYLDGKIGYVAGTDITECQKALHDLSGDLATVGSELREAHELGSVPPRGAYWTQPRIPIVTMGQAASNPRITAKFPQPPPPFALA